MVHKTQQTGLGEAKLRELEMAAQAIGEIAAWQWQPGEPRGGPAGDDASAAALWAVGTDSEVPDLGKNPAIQRYLEAVPPGLVMQVVSELRRLRNALQGAIHVLSLRGLTPQAFESLSPQERGSEEWQTAVRLWRAAGIPCDAGPRVLVRYTTGPRTGEHEYTSPELALESAITAIELNEGCPEAIEIDGARVMSQADILRAWQDRHDPY